ncbi:hypothetical protein CTAYLR_002950 [Chrysophaeum taylorii]|uniref:endo-1,4-beta-xylanase n=1 Tax=Chrysophaeum taylorii TaxID=2483200 RepID=A0AAD7UMR3_9STRA|nr:hypothetical protein CTAYLR_002950 [Chrysophaeum taylorii]
MISTALVTRNRVAGVVGLTVLVATVLSWRAKEFSSPTQQLSTQQLSIFDVPALRGVVEAGKSNLSFVGTAVEWWRLEYEDGYAQAAARHYNLITMTNDCKWSYLDEYNFSRCDAGLEFASAQQMGFRFHTLLWMRGGNPAWLDESLASADADKKQQYLHDHVANTVSRYSRAGVVAYDVINEAVCDFGYMEYTRRDVDGRWVASQEDCFFSKYYNATLKISDWYSGNDPVDDYETVIDDAFRQARLFDPDALLCLNDYQDESASGFEHRKSDNIYALVRGMLERGVPIDCVGIQTHVDLGYNDRRNWYPGEYANYQRLQDLGLRIMVTEFEARCTNMGVPCKEWDLDAETTQAELYAKGTRLCQQFPACMSFTTWGFTDAASHSNTDGRYGNRHPLPFDENFDAKPAYFALFETLSSPKTPLIIDDDAAPAVPINDNNDINPTTA